MSLERVQKKVSLTTTITACASTLLVSVAGSVAWATQFQTKTTAAAQLQAQSARVDEVKARQDKVDATLARVEQKVDDTKATTDRLEDKMDKLLSRVRR